MSKKSFLPLILLIGIGIFFSFKMIADNKSAHYMPDDEIQVEPFVQDDGRAISKNQAIQETIHRVISEGHFSPKDLNDDFSKKVFDKYLEMTDYGKLFLLQQDIDAFREYETRIDDDIKEGKTDLFDLVNERIKSRMKDASAFYTEALKNPFTFNSDEFIELDGKKLSWCANEEEMKQRWYKSMKYRTLARLTELKDQQKTTTDKGEKEKTLAQLEIDARENVKKSMDNYFKRLNKINETDRFATYMNSICHVVDPHTDFFPPKDKQRFDEEMSGSFIGIGAVLQSDGSHCTIKQIVTGSPCWKEGRLKVNDVILKVAQGSEEPVDIAGWDTEDIVSIIRGKLGTEVRLTVKHLDGSQEVISIIRGKVETEATFAKSSVINIGKTKIGYILLPEFYASFNESNGRRCAVDMAIEIEKLKKENVSGLIVDLRGNGGGSLSDVVEIGGMFIDKGPIVQVKSKGAPAQTLNDENAGSLYDGPLTILVNQGSASASEILAAAMQDYKRGIVLGTTSFGKGTVQRVYPLEDFYGGEQSLLPFGSIKLTLQKFYRINGGSTQLKGVNPDVTLPDLYELLDVGERKDENSLPWDQIAKSNYKPIKNDATFATLIENSKKRVGGNTAFTLIRQNATLIKKQNDDNKYSLNENVYSQQLKEAKDLSKKIEDINKNKKVGEVSNLMADKSEIQKDSVKVRTNKEWLENLSKDPYVAEASNVILDWINLEKGNKSSVNTSKN